MAGDRIFNFNGANVTFNDIHDNNNCTIITGRAEEFNEEAQPEENGGEPKDEIEVVFPFFYSKATQEQKEELERALRDAIALGPRAIVDVFIAHQAILDIRYRKQTEVHKALQNLYGLKQGYDAYNTAMQRFFNN